MIARHHMNWRTKAIAALEKPNEWTLNYSGVIGVSRADAERIKALFLDAVENTERLLRESPEEEAYILICDFFPL